ncbi:thiamine phosphate synthase [Bacillus alveayuensis]|uniref:thiamine phosphate synthase n=1 Tax=Aeribacillus alveayuensis TaxID=279215 RepID=UPI0005D130B1|nr:thiamine phosphate synthase [Bacillus alveayuensis]
MERISREMMRKWLSVYFIMGSQNCKKDPLTVLTEAIDGGITLFQFREKGKNAYTGEKKRHFATKLQSICREHNIPFIVNDDVQLAMELDADGVHIGQEDEKADIVRRKIGHKILGVSAHNLKEAREAIAAGADYIGVGPIFPTSSKDDAKEAQGPSIIRSLRESGIQTPIVAIGGITPENAKEVIHAGADGVSVISAIASSESPFEAARELVKNVKK